MFDVNHFKKWRKNTGVDEMIWGKFNKISSFSNIFKTKNLKVNPRKFVWRSSETNTTSVKKKIFFVIREEKKN